MASGNLFSLVITRHRKTNRSSLFSYGNGFSPDFKGEKLEEEEEEEKIKVASLFPIVDSVKCEDNFFLVALMGEKNPPSLRELAWSPFFVGK